LIPRPETEHLVETAVAYLRNRGSSVVLDVGTGSGAIAISLALETGIPVFASDISTAALRVAERNRAKHDAVVTLFAADLLGAIAPCSIDLIISNPPYVPGGDAANMQAEVRDWEPHVALFAGDSGFEIYRRLTAEAAVALRPGGRLMMELGFQSLAGVRDMMTVLWTEFEVISDLAGFPRMLAATLNT
jgi:release factor glutamine methyltransferase